MRWFLIIHNKEDLARVDAALPFPLFLKQPWKPSSLLCRQQPPGDAPSLGLESGLGVNLHDASTPANPGMSELLGQPLIPICQRLTSCPERTVKTAFSNQPSGELGSYKSLGLSTQLSFTSQLEIRGGNSGNETRSWKQHFS